MALIANMTAVLHIMRLVTPAADELLTSPPSPDFLENAHSHNDYLRQRPLFDALACGFASIEVDVFLVNGKLLVGHDRKDLTAGRTLETLYLKPLSDLLIRQGGSVYKGISRRLWVLVDIKTDAEAAYERFKIELQKYPSLMPCSRDRGVRFVISGARPVKTLLSEKGKFAALDGRLTDLDQNIDPEIMPWVSSPWTRNFNWIGSGPIPAEQARKLTSLVKTVRDQGYMIRFWGAPDLKVIWDAQKQAGVSLLNTDKPAKLQEFLLGR